MVVFVLLCFVLTTTWVAVLVDCLSFTLPLAIHLRPNDYNHRIRYHRPLPWLSRCSLTNPISVSRPTTSTLRLDTTTTGENKNDIDYISAAAAAAAATDNNGDKTDNSVGLYIHIPYCRQRCRYCDFAIVPIGDHDTTNTSSDSSSSTSSSSSIGRRGENNNAGVDAGGGNFDHDGSQLSRREQGFRQMDDRYVSAVVAELKQIAAKIDKDKNNHQKIPLRSVYFGGGTPSLAPVESIEKIMYHVCGPDNPEAPFRLLRQQINNKDGDATTTTTSKTEITMEMDPGTFDRDQLCALRTLGINRISLGVQSFDDDLLRAMGRTHRRVDVLQAISDIAFVYGNIDDENNSDDDKVNYSIDLISGCPGLTLAKWVETLEEATAGVQTKKTTSTARSTSTTVARTSTTTKKQQSLLLSSLPPPKHISVYDMQIEEGTVFGKLATKAKAAATERKEGEQTTNHNEDDDDDDEDASRQFTVAVSIDDDKEVDGALRRRRRSQQQQNPNQQQRLLRLPTEEECAFMYKYAAGYLRAKKYEHYEVSSYAAFDDNVKHEKSTYDNGGDDDDVSNKSNIGSISKRSRHNQIYWEYDGQWYAVGLGATSFVDKKLVARPREMSAYLDWVAKREDSTTSTNDKEDAEEEEDDNIDEDFLTDLLLKRLRTIDGLDLTWLKTHYGSEVVKDVLDGAKLGLELGLAEQTSDNVLRLTDPDG